MPFVSDAQRKHFFANNQSSGSDLSFSDLTDADVKELGDSWREMQAGDAFAQGPGTRQAMPQMTESEKVDWAAYRGDFGKK